MISVEQSVKWFARETKVLGENLPQFHFVHNECHMSWPGLEPWRPRWEAGDKTFYVGYVMSSISVRKFASVLHLQSNTMVLWLVTSVVLSEPGVLLPPGRSAVSSASSVERAALCSLRGPERPASLHTHDGPGDRRRKMSTGSDGASRPRDDRPPGSPKENPPVQVTGEATGLSSLLSEAREYFALWAGLWIASDCQGGQLGVRMLEKHSQTNWGPWGKH
jgi:hypothetical protein